MSLMPVNTLQMLNRESTSEGSPSARWNLAFENQVFVDEFFRPIQPLGISDLQTQ